MTSISRIEQKLGYPLPKEYKSFLLQGKLEAYKGKMFRITHPDQFSYTAKIEVFVTSNSFLKDNQYRSYLADMAQHFELEDSFVEVNYLYCIAVTPNLSVYMALNGKHQGKIYTVDNGDFGILYQKDSLKSFLESLF